jgi:quinolinate synthase
MSLTLAPPTLRADITLKQHALLAEITELKQRHNAIILAHLYERLEVQDVADVTGDSLGLSQQAASTQAETIVFCGVHFMAETAKLLSPDKRVVLANPNAGCPMADMITAQQLRDFKAQYPGVPVVAYVNTSAAVKAESTLCCTSANAIDVVASLKCDRVLFVPDKHLAAHVQQQLPHVEVIAWDGFCPVHLRIDVGQLDALRLAHPQACLLVHPECDEPVKERADFIGSTTAILAEATRCANQCDTFIICTEDGVTQRLQALLPHKTFITPSRQQAICPNMKMTRLEHIAQALRGDVPEITLPETVAIPARATLDAMLAVPVSTAASQAGGSSAACRCKR